MDPPEQPGVYPGPPKEPGTGQVCGGCLPIQHKDLLSPLPCSNSCLPRAGNSIPTAMTPHDHSSPSPRAAAGETIPSTTGGTFGRELLLQPEQVGYHTHGGEGRNAKSPSSSQEHLNPKVRLIAPSSHAPGLQLPLPHMSHVSHGLCHSTAAFAVFPERSGFVHRSKAQDLGTTAGGREGRAAGAPCSWQHLSPPSCPRFQCPTAAVPSPIVVHSMW